jgi:xanthine dehydrogenase accessory factor
MTIRHQNFRPSAALRPKNLLAGEYVIEDLKHWRAQGLRTCLVTLIGVDGGAPRQAGAQMAIAEDGQFAGYLSGGCLEAAVVVEAQAVITSGQNRFVRYGRGSPYFDIKLPCGGGLDLYFDQGLASEVLDAMNMHYAERQLLALQTQISTGASRIEKIATRDAVPLSSRDGELFSRVYAPPLRVMLIGNGPPLVGVAALAAALGVELTIQTNDEATRAELADAGLSAEPLRAAADTDLEKLDFATAAALFFHDHAQEPKLLQHILKSKAFYVGALGHRGVHRQRLEALAALGVGVNDLARIHAPAGSIDGAKSKATLAIGVLAEIMAAAKTRNLVA